MSTEEAKPIVETPAASAVEPTPEATTTQIPAVTEPVVEKPAESTEIAPAAKTEEPEASTTVPEVKEEGKPVEPKEEGSLAYNAPTNFLKELIPFPPKKQFFWLGTEPTPTQDLNHYLAKGKEAAHSTAAWASQTGTGLLFFSKHGEKKESPTGVLNLADAEDIKASGTNEFSFKLGGHKHKFESTERDGWLLAIKNAAEEAKAKKEEIVNSEAYKEALAKLKPAAAVIAPVSAAKADATPKKSTEIKKSSEETPAETAADEGKKTSKSRSRSRGAPASIVGFFKGKKEEAKAETKKEEPVAEPAAIETAPTEPVTEPVAEPVVAPVITDAVPPVEEKKVEEDSKKEEAKPNRRMSRFENFFKGKTPAEKAPESKESDVAPISDTAPVIAEPSIEPTPAEPVVESSTEAAKEEETKATTPTKERKPSMLAGLKSFTQKVRSPSSEAPPAVDKKEETAPLAETSETPAVLEPVSAAPLAEEAPTTNGDKAVSPTAEPKEKRRSSFFAFDTLKSKIPKSEKKTEPSTSTEEPAKTEAPVEEVAKPVEETPVVAAEPEKKSEEIKPTETPKVEKEYKASPISQLGRRFSKAIRGDKKKETKPVTKVDESSETAPKLPEPETEPAEPAKEEKPVTSIGDVVPEAVTVGTAPPASSTVSATA